MMVDSDMADAKAQSADPHEGSTDGAALMAVCRRISDEATSMMEKARWSGARMGDQVMAGRRGLAEGITADYLSIFSSSVARGDCPDIAYKSASNGLRSAMERYDSQQPKSEVEWKRGKEFGQDVLRFAFWRVRDAIIQSTSIGTDTLITRGS